MNDRGVPKVADQDEARFEGWAIIELMGHRRVAGYLTEREVAGARFLQVDIPVPGGGMRTQLYAPQAVYCITPVAEDVARAVAVHAQPYVVSSWELRNLVRRERAAPDEGDEDDYVECDEDDDEDGEEGGEEWGDPE